MIKFLENLRKIQSPKMPEEKSVFSKFWFWLLIIGLILFIVGIIALIMKRYTWWVWTSLGVGVLFLIIGGVGWAMEDAEKKGTTLAGRTRDEAVRVVHHLDPRARKASPRRTNVAAPPRRRSMSPSAPPYDHREVSK